MIFKKRTERYYDEYKIGLSKGQHDITIELAALALRIIDKQND
jgi:hypothetical protein